MNARVFAFPVAAAVAPAPAAHRPPMAVHAYLASLLEAANSLLRNDFEIVLLCADGDSGAMAIELRDSPHLRRLVDLGLAGYGQQGYDAAGPYRIGGFTRCGVACWWREGSAA